MKPWYLNQQLHHDANNKADDNTDAMMLAQMPCNHDTDNITMTLITPCW